MMTRTMLNGLKEEINYTHTENGAVAYRSSLNKLLDLFAQGGAYRNRSDEDCIKLFMDAFYENKPYAMKCLFYLRDIIGGAGERRFFRVVINHLARNYPDVVCRNLESIPRLGRWDDLYALVGTPIEADAFALMKKQLELDVQCETPSLLAKWMKSINTSSEESRELGQLTRKYLGMTNKQYRKTLSILRERIKVLERLMSAGRWDEIKFDSIPSVAGFRYRNAFARNDIIKAKYETFAKDKKTTVNAKSMFLYEIVQQVQERCYCKSIDDTNRIMLNKYWENAIGEMLEKPLNGIVVADTSGSMFGLPMSAALSLAMYCAERAKGPYHGHFITFSAKPKLVEIHGQDIVEKVYNAMGADWGMNTNIAAVFDLLLKTAIKNNLTQDEIMDKVIICTDMQFDRCVTQTKDGVNTLFEQIKKKWAEYGYKLPQLIFWNLNAFTDANFQLKPDDNVCYCSGFNQNLFEQIIDCASAFDLMYKKLDDKRYADIY